MFVMFFNVVFSMFVCYSAAFCQLCFYNKDWIGLEIGLATRMLSLSSQILVCGQRLSYNTPGQRVSATILAKYVL